MRSFRQLSLCGAISVAAFVACEPDLAPLYADYYSGGQANSGGSRSGGAGGSKSEGGSAPRGGASGEGGMVEEGGTANNGGTTNNGTGGGDAGNGTGGDAPLPESCSDRRRSSDESDIDCGGTSRCPRCEVDGRCTRHSDCATEICLNARCVEPSCGDGLQNQNETGIDCGGVCSPGNLCDNDVGCGVNGDCASGYCLNRVCSDHCTSKRKEADETGTDCGGSTCPACAENQGCLKVSDCLSGICKNNVCQAPTCDDQVKNQDESDVDCGGSCSPAKACQIDDHCTTAADCASYVCTANKCVADIPATAYDMIDNLEDGNLVLPKVGGRQGNWYGFGDGSGPATLVPAIIPGKRGTSTIAAHFTTSGNKLFSGCGFDFDNPGVDETTKVPWDGSAYRGITFWAKAATTISTSLLLPDRNTHKAGGICSVCDHSWGKFLEIDTEWRRYTVLFADLTLEPGTVPEPTAFDSSGIVLMQFFFGANADADIWVDDVALLK